MIATEFYFEWESALIILLQSMLGPVSAGILSFVTIFGEEVVLVLILGIIYWGYDKELGEKVGVNLLVSTAMCMMLKNLFFRLRPYFVIPEIQCLDPVNDGDIYDVTLQGYSFPSGHSCSAAAGYGTIAAATRSRWLRFFCIALIIGVGFSRIGLGVHYPTDVIAGMAAGLLIVGFDRLLFRRIKNRAVSYLILAAVFAPGLFFCRTEDFFTSYGILAGGLGGMFFEQKKVGFEVKKKLGSALLRTAGGAAAFLAINMLLKYSISALGSFSGQAGFLLRTLRYGLSTFVALGIYPFLFRLEKN